MSDEEVLISDSIFRKKSLDHISSPEEIDDYIQVTKPGMWLVLAAIVLMLTAVIIWGIAGEIEVNVIVNGEVVTETVAPISFFAN